jgi:hypothetical protein
LEAPYEESQDETLATSQSEEQVFWESWQCFWESQAEAPGPEEVYWNPRQGFSESQAEAEDPEEVFWDSWQAFWESQEEVEDVWGETGRFWANVCRRARELHWRRARVEQWVMRGSGSPVVDYRTAVGEMSQSEKVEFWASLQRFFESQAEQEDPEERFWESWQCFWEAQEEVEDAWDISLSFRADVRRRARVEEWVMRGSEGPADGMI